jgi:hypothetical protein
MKIIISSIILGLSLIVSVKIASSSLEKFGKTIEVTEAYSRPRSSSFSFPSTITLEHRISKQRTPLKIEIQNESSEPSDNDQSIEWFAGGNGHHYKAVHVPEGISWTAASNAAAKAGGYLATITSSNENNFVFSLIEDPKFWEKSPGTSMHGPWLGGFRSGNSFEWVTGEEFTYTNWAGSNPNGTWAGIAEDKIHYLYTDKDNYFPTWNDNRDDPSLWGEICGTLFDTVVTGYIIEYESAPAE